MRMQTHPSPNTPSTSPMKEIYLAGGCFWGTEHFFKQVRGVISTEVGYANGHTSRPSYEEVCSHTTGFAEAVHITYAPDQVSLSKLLELYFLTIDPTSLNKQGGDVGDQYRTGIYYTDTADLPTIKKAIETLQREHTQPIVIEVEPLRNFYDAETYHQDYLDKNPSGYCHIRPELFQIAREANAYVKPSDEELRRRLTPTQYAVTQHAATEHPLTTTIGTRSAKASMSISRRANRSSSPRISSTRAADGLASPAPLTPPLSASIRTTPTA